MFVYGQDVQGKLFQLHDDFRMYLVLSFVGANVFHDFSYSKIFKSLLKIKQKIMSTAILLNWLL